MKKLTASNENKSDYSLFIISPSSDSSKPFEISLISANSCFLVT